MLSYRFFLGFAIVFLSLIVGCYVGVVNADHNFPEHVPIRLMDSRELLTRHKTILENNLKLSRDQWSGRYESLGSGSLVISQQKGFYLGERISGCFGFPPVIGKVKVFKDTLALIPYATPYNGIVSNETMQLGMVSYDNKHYLIPQKSRQSLQGHFHHLRQYCNENSLSDACEWVFEKRM